VEIYTVYISIYLILQEYTI